MRQPIPRERHHASLVNHQARNLEDTKSSDQPSFMHNGQGQLKLKLPSCSPECRTTGRGKSLESSGDEAVFRELPATMSAGITDADLLYDLQERHLTINDMTIPSDVSYHILVLWSWSSR
jgi:hypothetical protein